MSETLNVRAVTDPVPLEGGGGQIGKGPVKVPNTWYYRRQICDGSLEEVSTEPVLPESVGPADSAGPLLDKPTIPSSRSSR